MRKILLAAAIIGGAFCVCALDACAGQPVFDAAPRWADGWGMEALYASHYSDSLMRGEHEIDNPNGLYQSVHTTWLQGVYTFVPEMRFTCKVPLVYKTHRMIKDEQVITAKGSGIGDIELGLPLKKYVNRKESTQEFGFTPSVRLPSGITSGYFPPGDGSTDAGFALSYKYETVKILHFYEAFYWLNNQGVTGINEGDEVGIDGNFGIHAYHDRKTATGCFTILNGEARFQEKGYDRTGDTGGVRLSIGPALMIYRRNVMFKGEYRIPVYERRHGTSVGYGHEISIGVGVAF